MMQKPTLRLLFLAIIGLLWAACAGNKELTKQAISNRLEQQTGLTVRTEKTPGQFDVPPGVDLSDGVTEEEAVAAALWNNPQFQADLTAIKMANADVIEAQTISNPLLRYLLPTGGVGVSGYINFAIDFIWQRPFRVAAANAEGHRTLERLIGTGYALIRDVQVAYADRLLAQRRVAIQTENAGIRAEIARLNNSRFTWGDISELEAATTRGDSAAAADDLIRAGVDTSITRNRLNALMGFNNPDTFIALQAAPPVVLPPVAKAVYLALAYENQPQLRSASAFIDAAGKRLGWERSKIINFTATLNLGAQDAAAGSYLPNRLNPGFQAEIPIFNRNQGRITRASAELEMAALQYMAVRQRITQDVTDAYNRYQQLYQSFQIWNSSVLPALEASVQGATRSYQNGDISYFPVLEATRQLLNGRLRQAEIEAELRRNISNLNFSIGQAPLTTE